MRKAFRRKSEQIMALYDGFLMALLLITILLAPSSPFMILVAGIVVGALLTRFVSVLIEK